MTVTTLTAGSSSYSLTHDPDIVTVSESGSWSVSLPPSLTSYQEELESLLARVFRNRYSPENLALAQQLSLNWCMTKCRQTGLSFEETGLNR